MKKRLASLVLLAAAGLSAEQYVGWVTDLKCAQAGNPSGDLHKKCVAAGQPVVFVSEADKKIYSVSNPDKVKDHLGKKVNLTGTAKGEQIEAQGVADAK